MPFAIYEISIRVGDWVRLHAKCPRYIEFAQQRGLVREVVLNNIGCWEVTVEFCQQQFKVDGRHVYVSLS